MVLALTCVSSDNVNIGRVLILRELKRLLVALGLETR